MDIKPDHELGYTETNLIVNLSEQEYKRFMLWMNGQTVAIDNGEKVFYSWDFERWCKAEPIID